jgi:hydrogenase expression/formation protein HypE
MNQTIKIAHGDGGRHTQELIKELFYKYFDNELLMQGLDAAVLPAISENLAFSTDSFVVKPLFFPGGNIGKLAACGTINDLVVSGAKPLYLSAGFIIEEGFSIDALEEIARSMGEVCLEARVKLVTGDTKVVEKGSVDEIFINTSGIGSIINDYRVKSIDPGDKIIVTGNIGDHGTTIARERYDIKVNGNFKSDCAALYPFLEKLKDHYPSIKIMRDPTRGGLVTVLHEFLTFFDLGIHLLEEDIPVSEEVKVFNQILGLEPLYMACEGRMVIVVKASESRKILDIIQEMDEGKEARIIGSFVKEPKNTIFLENYFGGRRILAPMDASMLPRIC